MHPDADLLTGGDGARPEAEMAEKAQKGPEFYQCLMEAAMLGMNFLPSEVLLAGRPVHHLTSQCAV
jgi:hypothetical protein